MLVSGNLFSSEMSYQDEITKAMALLARDPRTVFVGQSVRYDGQRAHATFANVPMDKRIEMPVCEDFQLGFCTGLALEGYIPVSFFPRWDFLIIAANQLVNHLDKIPELGGFRPKVIIRTAVGAKAPLNPGPQHIQDHSAAFRQILQTIDTYQLLCAADILPAYEAVMRRGRSAIVVEYMARYGV